jgi:hypothetical protein
MTMHSTNAVRSAIAAARFCAAALVPWLIAGCRDSTSPPVPPYLAVVTRLTTWPGATAPTTITYRIRQSSAGALPFDEQLTVSPTDTIVVPLSPGSYVVEASGLPPRCVIPRGATQQGITLTENDNTGVIRYQIECRGQLSVTVVSDGYENDNSFVYRVRNITTGAERAGLTPANDTITVEDIGSGNLEVDIGGVAPHCIVTSDGGTRQRVTAAATGGAAVAFRVQCADVTKQPRIVAMTSGYTQGASIFQFSVIDPDADLVGYYWDITDCEGNSVLPDKRERVRLNIRSGRGLTRDTVTMIGAFELGLPNSALVGRCTEIRVFDAASNVSRIVTHRIGTATGAPPVVRFFNATLQGQAFVSSILEASDPDGDIVGHFVLVRLRDGVLAAPDGVPDLGSMDPSGYLGLQVPSIPTTGRIKWDDVYAVIVYIIDARGNVVRVEDTDVFR